MDIKLKRVTDVAEAADGHRVFVDKLWPHGVAKSSVVLDEWLRDLAPSTTLRRFFKANEQANWQEFAERYEEELRVSPAARNIVAKWQEQGYGTVTLLVAQADGERGAGAVLQRVLQSYC